MLVACRNDDLRIRGRTRRKEGKGSGKGLSVAVHLAGPSYSLIEDPVLAYLGEKVSGSRGNRHSQNSHCAQRKKSPDYVEFPK